MELDLDRLETLAKAATRGPWQWVDPVTDDPCLPDAPCERGDHHEHAYRLSLRTVEEFPRSSVGPLPHFIIYAAEEFHEVEVEPDMWTHPDAEYIAAMSPEVVLELIARVRGGEVTDGE